MAVSIINHINNTKIQQNQQIPVNPRRCHWAQLNCPFRAQGAGCDWLITTGVEEPEACGNANYDIMPA